jgi:hypothetical protein
MGSLMGGDKTSTSTNESSSTNEMYQQDYFDKLLGNADSWLSQAQGGNKPNYIPGMEQALAAMGNQYGDVLSGNSDKTALNNALQSQAQQATQAFDRNVMPGITQSSNAAGQSGGSRAGIAEGIARGDLASSISNNQAQTINQFQQQEQANKMNAAQGMGNLFGQIGNLQTQASANTPQAQALKDLMAYQQLISGNMGGTQNTTGSGTSTTPGASPFEQLLGIGATAGGIMSGAGAMGYSDEKLKKKIKKKKDKNGNKLKTKDGIDLAEWEWNDKGEALGLFGKDEGVIAQEAEKKRPDAVSKDKKGYKKVNYGALM